MTCVPETRTVLGQLHHNGAVTNELSFSQVIENERRRLAPRARFELATLRLTAECSTIELPGNRASNPFIVRRFPQ